MQTTNWYAYLLGEARVYSDKRKHFLYGFCFALGCSIVIGLIAYLIFHDVARFLTCIFSGLMWGLVYPSLTWLLIPSPHYVIGSKGLIYFSGQYILYTPWENIGRVEGQHDKTPPSIWLKQVLMPMTVEEAVYKQQAAIVGAPSPNKPIEITDPKDTRMQIALPSSPSWQKTALGQDILRYAPHLA
ncbi:hypothetical protein [Ktedonobacter robiniae]|uniref:PrgI family protein n=1 Tax=Ktedonobacter robiniae TaxID=2778365 RepID=A0ABQ3UY61_9CHLR|nr:hypothetical protein [Ktedonobacter robiniae]GHO57305.1 hypothetical protein KSB_57800 [Ktedonobacter robiniae]